MLNAGHWMLDSGLWALDFGLWTLLLTASEQNQNSVSDSDYIMQNSSNGNISDIMITLILQRLKVLT